MIDNLKEGARRGETGGFVAVHGVMDILLGAFGGRHSIQLSYGRKNI